MKLAIVNKALSKKKKIYAMTSLVIETGAILSYTVWCQALIHRQYTTIPPHQYLICD